MNRKSWFLMVTLGVALVAAVVAQTPTTTPAPEYPPTANPAISAVGTVASFTSTELVMDTDNGSRLSLTIDPKAMPYNNFAVGQRVSVQYHNLPNGKLELYTVATLQADVAAASPSRPPVAEPASSSTTAKTAPETSTASMPPVEEPRSPSSTAKALPKTASPLPLFAGLALLAAAGALTTRSLRV